MSGRDKWYRQGEKIKQSKLERESRCESFIWGAGSGGGGDGGFII